MRTLKNIKTNTRAIIDFDTKTKEYTVLVSDLELMHKEDLKRFPNFKKAEYYAKSRVN